LFNFIGILQPAGNSTHSSGMCEKKGKITSEIFSIVLFEGLFVTEDLLFTLA